MRKLNLLLFAVTIAALLVSCACPTPTVEPTKPAATKEPAPAEFKVVVIGKSVHPYWSNVEAGIHAAAKDLGLRDDQVVFFVSPTEDVTKQIETMETYIAQGVTGIAVAPSDPSALEPVMQKASEAGIMHQNSIIFF